MTLSEARELRNELDTIEGAMRRIQGLWLSQDFPTAEYLEDVSKQVGGIAADLEHANNLAQELPCPCEQLDLETTVENIAGNMEAILERADDLEGVSKRVAGAAAD
jgi:hypothetical protein